ALAHPERRLAEPGMAVCPPATRRRRGKVLEGSVGKGAAVGWVGKGARAGEVGHLHHTPPARTEDARELLHDPWQVIEVLEHVEGEHRVEARIPKGEMRGFEVRDDVDPRQGREIDTDGAGVPSSATAEIDAACCGG